METNICAGGIAGDSCNVSTVLPLIIPAGIINFLPFFPAGIIRGRELLEVLKIYS